MRLFGSTKRWPRYAWEPVKKFFFQCSSQCPSQLLSKKGRSWQKPPLLLLLSWMVCLWQLHWPPHLSELHRWGGARVKRSNASSVWVFRPDYVLFLSALPEMLPSFSWAFYRKFCRGLNVVSRAFCNSTPRFKFIMNVTLNVLQKSLQTCKGSNLWKNRQAHVQLYLHSCCACQKIMYWLCYALNNIKAMWIHV